MYKRLLFLILIFLSLTNQVSAENYCNDNNAKQVAKIVYKEVGGVVNNNSSEDFFAKLVTASIIVNNAYSKSGSTFNDKLFNLTDYNYAGYSSYKNSSFESVVGTQDQGKMLYIAELVLTGRFSVPKEMHLQASREIVERYGTVWTSTPASSGGIDVFFGYEGTLSNKDIYGHTLSDTTPNYYRSLASSLMKSDYSSYTTSNVCNGNSSNNNPPANSGNTTNPRNDGSTPSIPNTPNEPSNNNQPSVDGSYQPNTYQKIELCKDAGFLRAIYIVKTLIKIIKLLVPIIIIIIGIKSFTKVSMDDGDIKEATKNLIMKIFVGVLIFFVPTIINSILHLANINIKTFNYNECDLNANLEYIKQIETKK